MAEQIKIFDEFLTPEELQICADTVKRPAWSFGHFSQISPIATPFWMMTLTDDPFFNTHLKSKIEAATKRKFTVKRVYANGQTFGQDGTYHQDDVMDNSYTFCIYINKQITPETADNIGGEFILKIPSDKSVHAYEKENSFSHVVISPIYNRGIFFNALCFHKGLAFNRYNKGLRVSISWKLTLI
jgi:hypothetical protein